MTACLNNEKQIGLAFVQYVQDNDEQAGPSRGYATVLYPYIKSKGVFACPDDHVANLQPGQTVVSYMINDQISRYDPTNPSTQYAAMSSWSAPSTTFFAAECQNVGATIPGSTDDGSPRWLIDVSGPDPNYGRGAMGALGGRPLNTDFVTSKDGRHNGGSNFIYIDGHVKWLLPTQASSGNTAAAANCNQDNIPAVAGCNGSPSAAGTEGTFANGRQPAGTTSPI